MTNKNIEMTMAEEMKAQERQVAIIKLIDGYEKILKKDTKDIEANFFSYGYKDEVEGDLSSNYVRNGLKKAQEELGNFWEEKRRERAAQLVEKRHARNGAITEINQKNWEVLELDVEINKLFNNSTFAQSFGIKQALDNKIDRLERQVMRLMEIHGIGYTDLSDESSDKKKDLKKKARQIKRQIKKIKQGE